VSELCLLYLIGSFIGQAYQSLNDITVGALAMPNMRHWSPESEGNAECPTFPKCYRHVKTPAP
jgi:hypothetical protein